MPDDTPQASTRAGIITPLGEGGIGIIAVVGAGAAEVLDAVFCGTRRSAGRLPPGGIAHGTIRRDGKVLDEVVVARLAGDDAAAEARFDVNCHGGVVALRAVLARIEEAGAKVVAWRDLAPQPSGDERVLAPDGIRAQALACLPRAPTRLAAAMLLHQADGALSRELAALGNLLAGGRAEDARTRLDQLLDTAGLGRALLRPPRVALLGPPNVGKSTLLNALLEEECVIVHHEPGTTRDVVAEIVSLRGVPFELLDCAGIGAAKDDLERRAMERAAELASSCDVALLLWDVTEGPGPLVAWLPDLNRNARAILVGNKIDLLEGEPPPLEPPADLRACEAVFISAKEKANMGLLEAALLRPYEGLIEHCRGGGAVIFDAQQEACVRSIRDILRTRNAQAARRLLLSCTGDSRSGQRPQG